MKYLVILFLFIGSAHANEKRRDSHIFCALTHPLLTFKLSQLSFVQDNDYDFEQRGCSELGSSHDLKLFTGKVK